VGLLVLLALVPFVLVERGYKGASRKMFYKRWARTLAELAMVVIPTLILFTSALKYWSVGGWHQESWFDATVRIPVVYGGIFVVGLSHWMVLAADRAKTRSQ
jgi:hypothetical protein